MKRTWLALVASLFPAAALATPPPPPAHVYDWCSSVVVRPDHRFRDGGDCDPVWRPEEIAKDAHVVLLGDYDDTTDPHFAHDDTRCGLPHSHEANARVVAQLHKLRGDRAPLRIVHMTRFDLVSDSLAALPGFRAEFLATTTRPWSDVLRFFGDDRSPVCGDGGCRWSDAYGAWEDRNKGNWLRDRIDAVGGKDRYQSVVYYIVKGGQAEQHFWPTAAIANQNDPGYRAWRVGLAKQAIAQAGYDAIALNQKLHQYRDPHWIGSSSAPDAAATRRNTYDSMFTGPPSGYGANEYMQGWVALASDLRAAGVPYAIVDISNWPWFLATDEPGLPTPDIKRKMRDVILGARIVLLERKARRDPAGLDAFAAELKRRGAQVEWVDTSCALVNP